MMFYRKTPTTADPFKKLLRNLFLAHKLPVNFEDFVIETNNVNACFIYKILYINFGSTEVIIRVDCLISCFFEVFSAVFNLHPLTSNNKRKINTEITRNISNVR